MVPPGPRLQQRVACRCSLVAVPARVGWYLRTFLEQLVSLRACYSLASDLTVNFLKSAHLGWVTKEIATQESETQDIETQDIETESTCS